MNAEFKQNHNFQPVPSAPPLDLMAPDNSYASRIGRLENRLVQNFEGVNREKAGNIIRAYELYTGLLNHRQNIANRIVALSATTHIGWDTDNGDEDNPGLMALISAFNRTIHGNNVTKILRNHSQTNHGHWLNIESLVSNNLDITPRQLHTLGELFDQAPTESIHNDRSSFAAKLDHMQTSARQEPALNNLSDNHLSDVINHVVRAKLIMQLERPIGDLAVTAYDRWASEDEDLHSLQTRIRQSLEPGILSSWLDEQTFSKLPELLRNVIAPNKQDSHKALDHAYRETVLDEVIPAQTQSKDCSESLMTVMQTLLFLGSGAIALMLFIAITMAHAHAEHDYDY